MNFQLLSRSKWWWTVALFFVIWMMVSIPSPNPQPILPDLGALLSPLFTQLNHFTARFIVKSTDSVGGISSDSIGFFLNVCHAFIFAFLIAIFTFRWVKKRPQKALINILTTIVSYYLAWQMLLYGWSKVFKWQFYLPEPNTLYTPLGMLSKDLLYWSTMGVSRTYTVFGGVIELLVAGLLFFRKTRLLGALLGVGVMANIVAINWGYAITVKGHSSFLLLLFLLLILPYSRSLWAFFILKKSTTPAFYPPIFLQKTWKIRAYRMVKMLVIGLLLFDSLGMYLRSRNFNDDKAVRPPLHGAYQVISGGGNEEMLGKRARRFFIHRQGFFIFQYENDQFLDYKLLYENEDKLLLTSTRKREKAQRFDSAVVGDTLYLTSETDTLVGLSLHWKELPLLNE